jgi:phage gp29-like protein
MMAEIVNENSQATPRRVNAPVFQEIGTTGLKESSGGVYEEFVPRLRWPKAGDVYLEMSSNDPVITAILLCSRQLIRNVTWDVKPVSKDPADMEAAEFLRQCMNDMSSTWSDFIDDVTTFFEYGFSYHEIVYKRRDGPNHQAHRNSKYNDQRIGWRKIAGRAQTSMQSWLFDDEGGLQGMYQYNSKGVKLIPISKSLLFRTTANRGNPEGRSFLRGAYRPWYFKKHIEEIEGIGIERDLAGLPVVSAPEGVDIFDKDNPKAVEAKTAALNLVTSIRRDRNEGVVLPSGWDLKLLSSASNRQFDTNSVINRYDQRIAITMLADIVMLGADKVGSFALAKVKQSMLAASLNAQLNSICDIFNRYAIPRLFALNTFNVKELPTITNSSVVAPDLKELGDYISRLSGSKMPLFPDIDLENHLRRVADLPETEVDDEERMDRIERSGENKAAEKTKEGGEKRDE